ncbi:MAG: hypothetical protein PHD04_00525 [Candidatus Pacebacteria bacterium]|nr:hypothetical protein [Candidatus Paceibacterota bacterium]
MLKVLLIYIIGLTLSYAIWGLAGLLFMFICLTPVAFLAMVAISALGNINPKTAREFGHALAKRH